MLLVVLRKKITKWINIKKSKGLMDENYNKELIFRKAIEVDIPNIVKLLADDELGSKRENYKDPLPNSYYVAFQNIVLDKNQELVILENSNREIIGTLQLTFIPYLTYRGGLRAQIEAVRVHKKFRGKGFGKKILKWAIKRSIDKGAHLDQLTTNKKRPDAIEFYKALGFRDSHMGMKLNI